MTNLCGPAGKYCISAGENLCPNCDECIACHACGCEEEITLADKVATAIEVVALVTWLIRPGNRTAELIRAYDKSVRETIARAMGVPIPKSEPEPEPWSQMPACGHIECGYACTYPKGIRPGD